MKGDFEPIEWLLACASMGAAASNFKVLRQGVGYVELLHKESGAVWRFNAIVIRKAAG